ncbi:glycan biosynthesis hexose transferase WsfD [Paenibacillus chungangensis]|uniref:Glycosyltransferase RgtA/B/C/D-like domain-containing protein n=1 Tax=Paenibacillus chungangensis TaxID=696535 RepID=A0ABW3HT91_9BACL
MKKYFAIENIYVVAAGCIAVWLLFLDPFIGVADNGDFLRIMGTAGLNYYDAMESYGDRFFSFAHALFAYDDFFRGFYPSTQILLVTIARFAGQLLNGSAFDIRILGFIYMVLLLAAGYIIMKYNKTRCGITAVTLAALMVFLFTDIGYLAYFNTLFGEPVSFVFLLLTIGTGLMLTNVQSPSRKLLVLFFGCALFLVCSKTQNAPLGIGFALIGLRYAWMKEESKWRILGVALAGATVLASVIMYIGAPKDFKHINMYQTVFFGILYDSPDVEGDLEQLGLPTHLSVLAGTNYFQSDTAIPQNDPSLKADFYDRVSHIDVLQFYMKNPSRLIGLLQYAAEHSMNIRPYYLGNYLKSEGEPPGALSYSFSGWSEFKRHWMPNQLWFIAVFFGLYFAVVITEWIRSRETRVRVRIELLALLGLTGIFSFMIPVLGDGRADLSKHLFLFNVVFDMMVAASIVWLVHQIASRLRMR